MRLIDADNMKTIHEIQMANFNSIEDVRKWIDRQPTAYDVEKVIDELDEVLCDEISQPVADEVVHIVRKGGVE